MTMSMESMPSVMESLDDKERAETIDLSADNSLIVSIIDATIQNDKVTFTVETKTTMPNYNASHFSVNRLHEEFVWLHERLAETGDYAGILLPPVPPRPDFSAQSSKLQNLAEMSDGTFTQDEIGALKKDLQQEYLAVFKKTVSSHELFLQRIAVHPTLRTEERFKVFLEFNGDLSVRQKSAKEKAGGLFKRAYQAGDELFLRNTKDPDEYFEKQRTFLQAQQNYLTAIIDRSEMIPPNHKSVAHSYMLMGIRCQQEATAEEAPLSKMFLEVSRCMHDLKVAERLVMSNFDLKSTEMLRYQRRNVVAGKELLYRRTKLLGVQEVASKTLDKARQKNKDMETAETAYNDAVSHFKVVSDSAKREFEAYHTRRLEIYQRNLTQLAELQMKHAKAQADRLQAALDVVQTL